MPVVQPGVRSADIQCMPTATPDSLYMREWIRAEFTRQMGTMPSEAMIDQLLAQMAERDERWAKLPQLSREAVHAYWREASEMGNTPQDYLDAPVARSEFLLELVQLTGLAAPSILEIGCNAGRNLACLYQAGYHKLHGVEISQAAVAMLCAHHPQLAADAVIHTAALEEVVAGFTDKQYDIVYSMAVLVHIHSASDWVFPHIARITRECLITIEDELNETPRHFHRDYQELFEAEGLYQVLVRSCSHIDGLGPYTARMFRRS